MAKYLFRIDDICETMNQKNFERLRNLFFAYKIKPLIAVIPENQDEKLKIDLPDPDFWLKIKGLENKGWKIAMHGYHHKYLIKSGGILKIHPRTEFATFSFEEQFEKIKKGKEILENQGIETNIFVAPGHSFDKITLKVLKKNNFEIISDGIALYPFEKYGIIWLPQIAWTPQKFKLGIITFSLHPNTMKEKDFEILERFLEENKKNIIDFDKIINWYQNQGKLKRFFLNLINFLFRPIWYLKFWLKL